MPGAWTRLLIAAAALAGLAALLPGPGQVARVLAGHRTAAPAAVTDTAMLMVAALIVWSLLAWILGIAAVAAVGRRPGPAGRRARLVLRHIAPVAVRNVLLTAAGVSLLQGLTACGSAAPTSHPAPFDPRITVAASTVRLQANPIEALHIDWPATVALADPGGDPAGGLSVDWPPTRELNRLTTPGTASPATTAPIRLDWPTGESANARPGQGGAPDGAVVVHRGDSLWSIAARHLPPGAAAADIERTWHRWYATNATVIGHDPNVILPGQILLPPTHETGE
jgi:hypothetical protein